MKKTKEVAGFKQTTELGALTKDQMDSMLKIENAADFTTAMMDAGMQMLLAVEEILIEDHNFSTKDLEHLETKLKRMMTTLQGLKLRGLTVLNYNDMGVVAGLAEQWLIEEKKNKGLVTQVDQAEVKLLEGK